MWVYKIKAEFNNHGFYRIPKTCTNGQFFSFEEMLERDEYKLVKSALCNWFNDKYNNKDFTVNMNGMDCIYLQSCDSNEMEEFYFHGYIVRYGYLIHHNNFDEYNNGIETAKYLKELDDRRDKIEKLLLKIKKKNMSFDI